LLPSGAGQRVLEEVRQLDRLRGSMERPYVAIASGSKIRTKVGMLKRLLGEVDTLVLGGQIANVFLAARGDFEGHTFHPEEVEVARSLWNEYQDKIWLPMDVMIGSADGSDAQAVAVEKIPGQVHGVWDIGPQSARGILDLCKTAKTIMWNGPVGMFEEPTYAKSTEILARGLSEMGSFRVVGGGDTVAALERCGVTSRYDHVSVGGGAMVAFLEGKLLPGLEPLYTEA